MIKIALVHDYLNQEGGAERVARVFCETFPEAPLFTSLYDPQAMDPFWKSVDIRTSFLQRYRPKLRLAKALLPLYPFAFEAFDLSDYDIVLSSSSTFAKGVITGTHTTHICYCHSPARYAWLYHDYIAQMNLGPVQRAVLPGVVGPLRVWDYAAAQRVDMYVANSRNTAARISKFYRRDAEILHPPIDLTAFELASSEGEYFVTLARLLPYKRLDIAIEACNRLKLPLVVIGEGPDRERLRRLAGPTITFAGRLPDAQVKLHLRNCRALLWPGNEDLGIAPLEALASGRPVLAYHGGGAVETLEDKVTGRFFDRQTVDCLADALSSFQPESFDPASLRAHVTRFDVASFQRRLRDIVARAARTNLAVLPQHSLV